jgi:thiamine biosynthesis lipoprotein
MTDLFRSMGCEIVVQGATARERHAIRRLFERRDRIFSRFIPESDLNRVNAGAERSPEFADMLAVARAAEQETGGLVTPDLGAELEAAGYDRDFELLGGDPTLRELAPRLDLNGVVKGRTVDEALAIMGGPGWVSAGGDIATRGPVVVGLPQGGSVTLVCGAIATSGSDRRRWLRDGEIQHHLIDPRTGRPGVSPWLQVTVCGASCLAADVAAKAAFLLGPSGPSWLDRRGLPGRFVSHKGGVLLNQAWARSLAKAA